MDNEKDDGSQNVNTKEDTKPTDIVEEQKPNEEESEAKYDKMIKVALIFCAWLLSCVLLYTYNSKRASNIEYNKLITRMNTNKLETQMKTFRKKAQEYSDMAYPIKALEDKNDIDPTGIAKTRRDLYKELIQTIELYDKCNYIRLNTEGAPFPMTELMISCILLLIILSIIMVSNLSNNPFKKMNLNNDITNIRESISKAMDTENARAKTIDEKNMVVTMGGGYSQQPIDKNDEFQAEYQRLSNLENTITNDINFLKSNSTFNYVSLSFSVVIFTVYISYKMLISSIQFKENLYSGTTFIKSRCYDI
jgi:hypothetical protein